MKTMTLKELRESLDVGCLPNTDRPRWFAAIDAAIRERDELCDRLDSALGDRIREFRRANNEARRADKAESALAALRDAGHAKVVPSLLCGTTPAGRHYVLTGEAESVNIVSDLIAARDRWLRDKSGRAKKAEAALAALRARITGSPACNVFTDAKVYCCVPRDWVGKRVRLLTEDDDV